MVLECPAVTPSSGVKLHFPASLQRDKSQPHDRSLMLETCPVALNNMGNSGGCTGLHGAAEFT